MKEEVIKIKLTVDHPTHKRWEGWLGPGKRIAIEQRPYKIPYGRKIMITRISGVAIIGTVQGEYSKVEDLTKIKMIVNKSGFVDLFYDETKIVSNYCGPRNTLVPTIFRIEHEDNRNDLQES